MVLSGTNPTCHRSQTEACLAQCNAARRSERRTEKVVHRRQIRQLLQVQEEDSLGPLPQLQRPRADLDHDVPIALPRRLQV